MSHETRSTLKGWLDTATKGLPPEVAARTRAELEAHYWDALDTYRQRNADVDTDTDGESVALIALGDAGHVNDRLMETHYFNQRYLRAALLAVLAQIAPLVLVWMIGSRLDMVVLTVSGANMLTISLGSPLEILSFVGLTLLALRSLRRLLVLRLEIDAATLERPMRSIGTSILCGLLFALLPVLSYFIYRDWAVHPDQPTSAEMITAIHVYAIVFALLIGVCGVAFGTLSRTLWRHYRVLFGALRILSLSFGYCGLSLILGAGGTCLHKSVYAR